jgi:hypothetical protein
MDTYSYFFDTFLTLTLNNISIIYQYHCHHSLTVLSSIYVNYYLGFYLNRFWRACFSDQLLLGLNSSASCYPQWCKYIIVISHVCENYILNQTIIFIINSLHIFNQQFTQIP